MALASKPVRRQAAPTAHVDESAIDAFAERAGQPAGQVAAAPSVIAPPAQEIARPGPAVRQKRGREKKPKVELRLPADVLVIVDRLADQAGVARAIWMAQVITERARRDA